MLLTSGDGCVLAVNPACEGRFGVSGPAWRGNLLRNMTVEPPDEVARYLQLCARSRQPVLGAMTVRGRDTIACRAEGWVVRPKSEGSDAVLMLRLVPAPAAVGQFIALNLRIEELGREIRRRKDAERAARDHAEQLRTTLASIGDGVIATDANGRITNMNGVAETLTGWANAEAIGQPIDLVLRIVSEATREPVENPAYAALREGVIIGLANHTILIARDGTEWPIDDSAAPIRAGAGDIVGAVLVFRDITERRRLDRLGAEQLHAAQRLSAIVESSEDAIVGKDVDGRSPAGIVARNGCSGTPRRRASDSRSGDSSHPIVRRKRTPSWTP